MGKDLLATLVKQSTGKAAIAFDRVVEGYCNEVYFVRTDPPGAYVVRITREGESGALEEQWCLRACADAGVPVPEVLGLESIEADGCQLDAMVLTKVPGLPLCEMVQSLSPTERAYAWKQMGTMLRKIHSIRAGGFYKRGSNGNWDFPDWTSIARCCSDDRISEKPFLLKAGFGQEDIAFMFEMIHHWAWDFDCPEPVLCHGDFLPEHVFFDESLNVTGVIDFGWYEGGPPIRDFLLPAMDYGDVEVAFLREGYGHSEVLDDRFDLRLHLSLVPFRIGVLCHQIETKDPSASDNIRGLIETIAWLRSHGIS